MGCIRPDAQDVGVVGDPDRRHCNSQIDKGDKVDTTQPRSDLSITKPSKDFHFLALSRGRVESGARRGISGHHDTETSPLKAAESQPNFQQFSDLTKLPIAASYDSVPRRQISGHDMGRPLLWIFEAVRSIGWMAE
jgi:hypothetical protein